MKCIIDAKELRETLKAVKPWVPLKPHLPIMAHVLIQADELGTHITAYDFEMFGNTVRFPVEAFRSENGACVVRFKDLFDVTSKAEGKVVLEFDKINRLRSDHQFHLITHFHKKNGPFHPQFSLGDLQVHLIS